MSLETKVGLSETRSDKIFKALRSGVNRPNSIRAPADQTLTYTLLEHQSFHHATLESASSERYFLQAALGRKVRIMKVWNVSREAITTDMHMLRAMLDETKHWGPANEALDRILKGAGH